jgi:hypothetical protein
MKNLSESTKGNNANTLLGVVCHNCNVEPKSRPINLATGEFAGYWFGCKCKHEVRLTEKDAKLAYYK